ncbi:MAG: 2OG-Fe(II) oxygenase [Porticoccaceae bacterium]|nr:2OG-Fe(II) oxygenase [Porticoccaceae bacterium]
MSVALRKNTSCGGNFEDGLFSRIARDLEAQGYSINPRALPDRLTRSLSYHHSHMEKGAFQTAGVGRTAGYRHDGRIRGDEICWITGESLAGNHWLKWTAELRRYLNHRLFLGLRTFESHFAHYAPNTFYRRHVDAFRGTSNRVLSLIIYLHQDWGIKDGGELIIYPSDAGSEAISVLPHWGTIVVFLSEDFPHEVLPARRDRYSVAGWFRND